jgi:hypothetical protein
LIDTKAIDVAQPGEARLSDVSSKTAKKIEFTKNTKNPFFLTYVGKDVFKTCMGR